MPSNEIYNWYSENYFLVENKAKIWVKYEMCMLLSYANFSSDRVASFTSTTNSDWIKFCISKLCVTLSKLEPATHRPHTLLKNKLSTSLTEFMYERVQLGMTQTHKYCIMQPKNSK